MANANVDLDSSCISEDLSDLSIEVDIENYPNQQSTTEHEDSDIILSEFGLEPYRFEPELSDTEVEIELLIQDDSQEEWRLHDKSWCVCNQCILMPALVENRCCQEINVVTTKMDELDHDIQCITEHPGFQPVCLDPWTLQAAYFQYRQQYGPMEDAHNPLERYRHTAYRQLVRFCWGWLGKKNRVILPPCAVNKIREKFPSDSGQYVGFLPGLQ